MDILTGSRVILMGLPLTLLQAACRAAIFKESILNH